MGSSTTRVLVGEFLKGEKNPKIIGMGEAPTRGLRHGYVVDTNLAVGGVREAVALAEKTSGIKIKRAFVSVSGVTLRGETSLGSAVISKADGEVTNLDINKALEDGEENLNLANKKIIQTFPISYKLDGKDISGRLEGTRGNKLEVKALFVTCSSVHLEDLLEVIALADIETIEALPAPIAESYIALSDKQKIVGGALVNIGSETVTLSIFENGLPVSIHTFSIGGEDITNDIALGLKIPLEKAESYKLGNVGEDSIKKKLNEIIEARLGDVFELIENHLKKIKRSELLPAGIVFVGGGSNILDLEEFSRSALKLPSKVGSTDIFGSAKTKLRDPSWFTALGLVIGSKDNDGYSEGSFTNMFKDLKKTLKSSVKQLMP